MPKVPRKPQMAPISRVLDKKVGGEDEILYPTPTLFDWRGKTYKIKPLSNKTLKGLASEFDDIIGLVARIGAARSIEAEASGDEDSEELEDRPIQPIEFLPYIPEVLEILLPNATSIIADSLRVDEELIEDEMFMGKRVECLRLIIEANDFPLLFANFRRLTGMFTPPQAIQETTEMNADETETTNGEAED